jgi:hypothetical protein
LIGEARFAALALWVTLLVLAALGLAGVLPVTVVSALLCADRLKP